ncbi:MAG: hypothetical protein KY455_13655 [Euryarchaeota archaeon]|nr:hypothetical protein [Euryarchaeota archaeon]
MTDETASGQRPRRVKVKEFPDIGGTYLLKAGFWNPYSKDPDRRTWNPFRKKDRS